MLCRILGHKIEPVVPITSNEESSHICVRCLQVMPVDASGKDDKPNLTLVRDDPA